MRGHEVILRTGKIFDFEMACAALKEAGIPYIKQEEGMNGVKDGFFHSAMAPGNFFNWNSDSSDRLQPACCLKHR